MNEPTLRQIDDYTGTASRKKEWTVFGIVMAILIASALFTGVKSYYDSHTPAGFNPVVVK